MADRRAIGRDLEPGIDGDDLADAQESGKRGVPVFRGRFLNALGFVRDRAYAKGWTYQRYARRESIRRRQLPTAP